MRGDALESGSVVKGADVGLAMVAMLSCLDGVVSSVWERKSERGHGVAGAVNNLRIFRRAGPQWCF